MQLDIVTPTGTAIHTEAEEVVAPGVDGEFGVLPGHTPFIAALRAGVLSYKHGGRPIVLAIGPGYAQVTGSDRVVILTQQSQARDKIDEATARKELDEAERLLRESHDTADSAAHAALKGRRDWAQARVSALTIARA